MKNLLVGSAAAQIVNSSASFCGCGDCSVDWLSGSGTQKAILTGLSCSQFAQLMSDGASPSIKVSDGEACTDLLS
jgi:hypothetical protein